MRQRAVLVSERRADGGFDALKICVVSSSYPRFKGDGAGNFIHDMCLHLSKAGDRVTVVAPHAFGSRFYENLDGVEVYRFPYWFSAKSQAFAYGYGMWENARSAPWTFAQIPLYMIQCVRGYIGLDMVNDFDVIFPQWALPSGLACTIARARLRKAVAVFCHGSDVFLARKGLLRRAVAYTLANSDLVLANAGATARRAREIYPNINVHVVGIGVDLNKFRSKAENVPKDGKVKNLLFVGRLSDQKGIRLLIKAMRNIAARCDARLDVVGDGPLREELQQICFQSGIQDKVRFLGSRPHDEIPSHIARSDLVVVPSITTRTGRTEAFGAIILEAMASGKAVVAGNVGGIPELVRDGVNGLLVDASNENELSEAVIRLLGDDELRERMGREGRRLAENHSWEVVASRIHNLLENMISA